MRGLLVALDLETTGLDIQKDEIIEIGAVRMQDGEILDEFSTMVNPGKPIPINTTNITGIRQEDVVGAPSIAAVLPQLATFVGNAPVIAHNITLDTGFLRDRYGILKNNREIDTYDLASILLPSAPRYNLNSLTQQLGVDLENAHRALDDARAAALLYWKLWHKAIDLPRHAIQQILQLSGQLEWPSRIVLAAALEVSSDSEKTEKHDTETERFSPESIKTNDSTPSVPDLSDDYIASVFSKDGLLAEANPAFRFRKQQSDMAQIVMAHLRDGSHCIIEAGTGTGKSFAYLVPAILWSVKHNSRVIVSTHTLNLQDQLMNDVLPQIQQMLQVEFKYAVLKGQSHYLSPTRLDAALRRTPSSILELLTLAKILVWQTQNTSGEKSDISLRGPGEHGVWESVSALHDPSSATCLETNAISPFCNAQRNARTAHIVVVNHALLIKDARSDSPAIPTYDKLIIDEAHHLEAAITNSLRFRIDEETMQRIVSPLSSLGHGLFHEILTTLRPDLPDTDYLKIEQFLRSIADASSPLNAHIRRYFEAVRHIVDENRSNRSHEFMTLLRIDHRIRRSETFSSLQDSWQPLSEFIGTLADALRRLSKAIKKTQPNLARDVAPILTGVDILRRQLHDVQDQLESFSVNPDENLIYWLSLPQGSTEVAIQSAPLRAGELVEKYLWNTLRTVILTSATLTTKQSFQFLQGRLNAENIRTHDLGSPFDYKSSVLVYLPTDIPEPTERKGYQESIERCVIELAAALQGRVMVLFTSFAQLRQTSQAVSARLALGDITVFDQSDGTSRHSLLEGFKSTEKAILLGTKSFWEGVDIPGPSLSALVITRLPFTVPSDPIFSARSETYHDPFGDFNLPDAILQFRQGFGRLIRTDRDRGVVVVMDSRLRSKRYGKHFIESLPECTIQEAPLEQVANHALSWLE